MCNKVIKKLNLRDLAISEIRLSENLTKRKITLTELDYK